VHTYTKTAFQQIKTLTFPFQIFPRHVIEALSAGSLSLENIAAMARSHEDVSILFLGRYMTQ
jgi:hypothetical protein